MTGAFVAALAVTLASVGCGQSATDKANERMNKSFQRLGIDESYSSLLAAIQSGNEAKVDRRLSEYLDAVDGAVSVLGKDEVKRELAHDANELQPFCGYCADELDRERDSLG